MCLDKVIPTRGRYPKFCYKLTDEEYRPIVIHTKIHYPPMQWVHMSALRDFVPHKTTRCGETYVAGIHSFPNIVALEECKLPSDNVVLVQVKKVIAKGYWSYSNKHVHKGKTIVSEYIRVVGDITKSVNRGDKICV